MEPTPEQIEKWELQQIRQSQSRLAPKPIAGVIRRLMQQRAYGSVEAAQNLTEAWARVVGDKICADTRVGKISRGSLLIEVKSSQALQELSFQKDRIVKQLNQELPEQKINSLRLKLG